MKSPARSSVDSAAEAGAVRNNPNTGRATARLASMLSLDWLAKTVASNCWIVSMLVYGLSSTGVLPQLTAGSAWCIANAASLASAEADGTYLVLHNGDAR